MSLPRGNDSPQGADPVCLRHRRRRAEKGTTVSGSSRSLRAAVAALLVAGIVAGCSDKPGDANSSGSGPNGVLTVTTGDAKPFVAVFNPYSPTDNVATNGMILEPLYYFDTVDSSQVNPWLATSYQWSTDGKSITFQLRKGVKWNDGQAFTADDVAFTFQQMIDNKTLNQYNLPLASVSTSGDSAVTLTFTQPEYSDLFYIAGKTMILPKHIWSAQSNPTTWPNAKPVGTGAFMVASVTPQALTLTANPHYYQADMPKFKTLRFLTYNGNNASNAALASGDLDWGGNYIPNIKQNYLSRNPRFAMVNIPLAIAFFVPNMKSGPASALPVRQAVSAALKRDFISQTVYDGNAPATNPMALLMPNYKDVLDPSLAGQKLPAGDPAQAKQILSQAGYKLGANGMFSDPSGKALDIHIQVISGYTDYVQILQIAQQQLKDAGINLVVDPESAQQFNDNKYNGKFDMLIDNYGYTPSPYTYYNNLLNSSLAPKGSTPDLVGNFGSYSNGTVDRALKAIASTTDQNAQKQAFYQIEQQFVKDVPAIPLFEQQNEIEFNGSVVTGYPTADNPYASPAIYMQPDLGWVGMRLAPAKG
jgi:peptide/nickel transport system substrate-binding protein